MPAELPVFAPNGISWAELGTQGFTTNAGDHWSGQVSAIAVDLDNDPSGNLVYIGSSSGGVWKSTNGRVARPRFVPISAPTHSLAVGSIALDTSSRPAILYVGTGAPDNAGNVSSYTGAGIMISRNDGHSWHLVSSADGGKHPFAGMGFSSILVDPIDPRRLLASTGLGTDPHHPPASVPQGNSAFDHLGIYRSIDAGLHWTQVLSAEYGHDNGADRLTPEGFFHIDLLCEPVTGTYFAGVSLKGLFISTDNGAAWTRIDPGASMLPAATDMHRISLATRNGVVWALVMKDPHSDEAFVLFESDDLGRSWGVSPLEGIDNQTKGFLMYVAAPPNSKALVIGVDDLFCRNDLKDAGSTWHSIGSNLHSDQHAIAFASAKVWYAGNDGGAWVTKDGGVHWTDLNRQLRTMQVLSAAADSGASAKVIAGLMDNAYGISSPTGTWSAMPNLGGDGLYCAADPLDSDAFFVSTLDDNFHPVIDYVRMSAPGVQTLVFTGNNQVLMMPYEVLPADPALVADASDFPGFDFTNARFLLVGATNLFLVAFNPDAPAGSAVALEQLTDDIDQPTDFVAPNPSDPTSAFAVSGPRLFRLTNIGFGSTVVNELLEGPASGRRLGHVAVAKSGPLLVTVVGLMPGANVFKSIDGGRSWINISGNLPVTPVNWAVIDGPSDEFIYLATNQGVYVATDGGVAGEQWQRLGEHLPHVPVTQLQRSKAGNLVASTWGRGVWSLDVSGAVPARLSGISLTKSTIDAGDSTTGRVLLSAPVWTRTRVDLVAVKPGQGPSGDRSTVVSVPASVLIEAGRRSAGFQVLTSIPEDSEYEATIYAIADNTAKHVRLFLL